MTPPSSPPFTGSCRANCILPSSLILFVFVMRRQSKWRWNGPVEASDPFQIKNHGSGSARSPALHFTALTSYSEACHVKQRFANGPATQRTRSRVSPASIAIVNFGEFIAFNGLIERDNTESFWVCACVGGSLYRAYSFPYLQQERFKARNATNFTNVLSQPSCHSNSPSTPVIATVEIKAWQ